MSDGPEDEREMARATGGDFDQSDADYATDHPPAIPPIGVRRTAYLVPNYTGGVALTLCIGENPVIPWTYTVPLGLSPEQPARCGGGE